MARSGIRYEDVKDTAETLLGRGLNPTIQRVRELLGTGSNTTISDHLKSWQQQIADAPKVVLPPTVPEAVMVALDAFWKIAVQQAEAAFAEQRDRAQQAVAAAEQSRDTALAAQQQMQSEAAEQARQLEAAQTASRDLADRLLVEQERRAAAETAIQAAEQQVHAVTTALTQIRAETAARIAQADAALQQARADMTQQTAAAQRRFEEERQRGEVSEARLMQRLDRERTEYAAERQALLAEHQESLNREAVLKQTLEQLQREQREVRMNLTDAQERINQLSVELDTVHATAHQHEMQLLEADHKLEITHVQLEAETRWRQQLEQEGRELRSLLLQHSVLKPGDTETS